MSQQVDDLREQARYMRMQAQFYIHAEDYRHVIAEAERLIEEANYIEELEKQAASDER